MSKLFDTNYHYLVPELTADSGEQLQAGWVPWAGGGGAAAAGSSRPAMSTCPPTHPPSHTHTSLPPPCRAVRRLEPPAGPRASRTGGGGGGPRSPYGGWCVLLCLPCAPCALLPGPPATPRVLLAALAASLPTLWPPPPAPSPSLPRSPILCAGPNTLVGLARGTFDRAALVARLVPAYAQLLRELAAMGVPEVQASAAQGGALRAHTLCAQDSGGGGGKAAATTTTRGHRQGWRVQAGEHGWSSGHSCRLTARPPGTTLSVSAVAAARCPPPARPLCTAHAHA